MTDGEYIAALGSTILTAGGVVAAAIRFAASRIIKALDKSSETYIEQVRASAIVNERIAALSEKFDVLINWFESITPAMGVRIRGKGETDPPAVPLATKPKTRFSTKREDD